MKQEVIDRVIEFGKKENMQSRVVIQNLHNEIDACNFDYKDIEGVYGYNIQQNLLPQNPHKQKNWNNTMEIEEMKNDNVKEQQNPNKQEEEHQQQEDNNINNNIELDNKIDDKLDNNKETEMDPPDMYLGANLSKMDNKNGDSCWAISSNDYCAAMIKNVKENPKAKVYVYHLNATRHLRVDTNQSWIALQS